LSDARERAMPCGVVSGGGGQTLLCSTGPSTEGRRQQVIRRPLCQNDAPSNLRHCNQRNHLQDPFSSLTSLQVNQGVIQ
jgi:hypothetical protein